MSPSFQFLATTTATICFALTAVWLLAPQRLLSLWGVTYSHPVGLVSRRGAALFLGIGVMFYLARTAAPSPSRSALIDGFVVACLSLAALGILELVKKRTGFGMLSAVLVEVSLAAAFLLQSGIRH